MKALRTFLLVAASLLLGLAAHGDTTVGGTIATNTTWTAANSPYIVTSNVVVQGTAAPVLTIEPGVTVKFNSGIEMLVNYQAAGSLQANGTASAPIVFTSNAASPVAGSWRGLYFGTASAGQSSSVTYATIEYGGVSATQRAGIMVSAGTLTLDHLTIRTNLIGGIYVTGGTVSVTNSTISGNSGAGIYLSNSVPITLGGDAITGNSGYAVSVPGTAQITDLSGMSASGNGTGRDSIEIRGGTVTSNLTLNTCALPYVVNGTLQVEGSSAPVLTIQPGSTLKFASGQQLLVNYNSRGGLQANGTAASPILFTSASGTAAGGWLGIYTGSAANPPASSLTYATVENGGAAGYSRGGLTLYAPIALDHLTVRNNAYAGVAIYAGTQSLTNSTVIANAGPGVYALNSVPVTLAGDAFTSNTGYAVSVPSDVQLSDLSGLSATGNGTGRDGIEMRGSSITANRVWHASAIPYIVSGGVYVGHTSAPTLTIEAGVTVRFNSQGQIAANFGAAGSLQVNGTAAAPVLFTTNAGATAGYWYGLYLGGVSSSATIGLSYATIEYGGLSGSRGGLTVLTGTATLDHVTIRNNAFAGVSITGGAGHSIRNSTITANGGAGINCANQTALTLAGDSFTGNSGYAVTVTASSTLADLTGLTASGNATGGDGIELRDSVINSDRTWPAPSIPYIVTGAATVQAASAGAPGVTLTLLPGTTIRFNPSSQLLMNYSAKGALIANGTPAAPILFTSNTTQTPGAWFGLYFGSTAAPPPSTMSYVVLEYGGSAGNARGGVTHYGTNVVMDHVTFRNNAYAGLAVHNSGSAAVINSSFTGNGAGVIADGSSVVAATLNYWGDPSGPCFASCTAPKQLSSGNATVEPWLLAAGSAPQWVSSTAQKNRTFNPTVATTMTLDFGTLLAGDWTVGIRNAANTVVRTFTGSGATGQIVWDGKDGAGVVQGNGTYSYRIDSTVAGAPPSVATSAQGVVVVDSARLLTISNAAVDQGYISPNGDAVQDAATVTATSNYDDPAWTVGVANAGGTVVRTMTSPARNLSVTWDGKDDGGTVVPDGLYTFRLSAVVGGSTAATTKTTTVDDTPPAAAFNAPTSGQVLSNLYQTGSTTVVGTATMSDANFLNWIWSYGAGSSPTAWTTINFGYSGMTNSAMGNWGTVALTNGPYVLKLAVTDRAGNVTTTTLPVSIGHFSASVGAAQFNAATGETLTYSSIIPFNVTETLLVKDQAGNVVRNLVPATARSAGTYNDLWNGRSDANAQLPDGPYFYTASVTDGTNTLDWDLTNTYRNDYSSYNDSLGLVAYDPFNNKPLKISYNFLSAGRVTIAMTSSTGSVNGDCSHPTATFFCPVINDWQESGPHTFYFGGIDAAGAYRTVRSLGVVVNRTQFARNAAILYGTKPSVMNVAATPAIFGPAAGGTQAIAFDLSTYQSAAVNVKVELRNQESLSVLRTLDLGSVSPGHITTTWDGRADNSMPVAPGFYTVTVTATDAIGNRASGQILTTLQY
jgi:flagellar hook assembly protein FlgD